MNWGPRQFIGRFDPTVWNHQRWAWKVLFKTVEPHCKQFIEQYCAAMSDWTKMLVRNSRNSRGLLVCND